MKYNLVVFQGRTHLKPDYTLGLTSGELYAHALGNIYRNPQFYNYTNDAVLDYLLKRGAHLVYDTGERITETDLCFNRPIRLVITQSVQFTLFIEGYPNRFSYWY